MPAISPEPRYPCGRKKKARPTTLAGRLTEQARRIADAETALSRVNPIRRQFGSKADSPFAASALGRFLLRHRVAHADERYAAAVGYGLLRQKWLSCMGAQIGLLQPCGSGNDVDLKLVRHWRATARMLEREMLNAGGADGRRGALTLIVDDFDVEPKSEKAKRAIIAALREIAHSSAKLPRPKE